MSEPATVAIVTEDVCQEVVSRADAFDAVEKVFAAMASGDAYNFPVIREAIGHADALYGFKSGFDRAGLVLGLKSGGYWPGNMAKGLTNHQSTVFLFDPDTGRLKALVGGNHPDRRAHRRRLLGLHQAPRPQGLQGARHGRRRPSGAVPAPRRGRDPPLREGRRLELSP
jgi:hypothetical protein